MVAAVVVLALVVVGLVAADRWARGTAEARVAAQVRAEAGLDADPEVSIGGRSFLWQAVRGRYDRVGLSAPRLEAEGTTVRDAVVNLRDVRVPLGVLTGSGGTVVASSGSARALVPWAVLAERASAATDLALELAPGPEDTVRAATTVRVLGRDVEVALRSEPVLDAGRLVLRPVAVSLGGRELSLDAVRPVLGAAGFGDLLREVPVPLDGLPDGVRPSTLRVVDGGVVVTAVLEDVTLDVPPR